MAKAVRDRSNYEKNKVQYSSWQWAPLVEMQRQVPQNRASKQRRTTQSPYDVSAVHVLKFTPSATQVNTLSQMVRNTQTRLDNWNAATAPRPVPGAPAKAGSAGPPSAKVGAQAKAVSAGAPAAATTPVMLSVTSESRALQLTRGQNQVNPDMY